MKPEKKTTHWIAVEVQLDKPATANQAARAANKTMASMTAYVHIKGELATEVKLVRFAGAMPKDN